VDELATRDPPLQRVPGTAVFLNRNDGTTPLAMRANVEHNRILHEDVVILALETRPVPHVPPGERITADDLGHRDDGITFVRALLGYQDEPNVPAMLPLVRDAGVRVDEDNLTYFLSTVELVRGEHPGMSRWRKHLFLATSRITADAAEHFRLPRAQTVIMGSRIEI
jgi:KUP system potassium uptake protein